MSKQQLRGTHGESAAMAVDLCSSIPGADRVETEHARCRAWGTAEPANLLWSRPELTELARRRAPAPTWLVVVGQADRPATATLRIARTKGGVEQDVTLVMGQAGEEAEREPPDEALRAVAGELSAEHGLVSLLVQRRQARADLTVPPHLEGAPAPIALALGEESVQEIGPNRARRPPLPHPPLRLGGTDGPGLYYPVAEGGWQAFQQLMGYLHTGPEAPPATLICRTRRRGAAVRRRRRRARRSRRAARRSRR
jgi:uncharacterized protein DUF6177